MKKIIIAAALALLPFGASAQFLSPTAASGAVAGAQSGSVAGAGAAGNIIQIDGAPAYVETKGRVDNVPNVIPPNVYPTAPCMGSTSIGVGVAGTGVSAGTSWIYENCEHRENARMLHAMGDLSNAKIALCMQTTMANHPMCATPTQQPAAAPAKTSAVDPRITRQDDRDRQTLPTTIWANSGPESCSDRQNGQLTVDSNGLPWECTPRGWLQSRR